MSDTDIPEDDGRAPYCTLFLCTLEQLTPLSVGGRDDDVDNTQHDLPLARDGDNRPILNGRTLAGALVATARTFLHVPEAISLEGGAPDDKARPPSLWNVWNAHLLGPNNLFGGVGDGPNTDSRAGNALRHDTRAPASHMLFDTEVLPAGQQWGLVVEVSHPPESKERRDGAGKTAGCQAAAILALALQEWHRERCWIGRRVARGMGWMRLAGCEVIELPRSPAAVDAWPDASMLDLDAIWLAARGLAKHMPGNQAMSLGNYATAHGAAAGPRRPTRAYVRWPLQVATGAYMCAAGQTGAELSYGLDTLSLGGHGGSAVTADELTESHLVRAEEQGWNSYAASFAPDFVVAMQPGSVTPSLPGSAIVGSWRHFLSRLARAAGQAVLDPSTGVSRAGGAGANATAGAAADSVTPLFGFVHGNQAASSALLVRDAAMKANHPWRVALLEKVALDEFSQGAFKGAKFNRMAVLEGAWHFDLVQQIEAPKPKVQGGNVVWPELVVTATDLVRQLLTATAQRRVALGGGEFRAYGHLPVTVTDSPGCQWAPAGEDWQDWQDWQQAKPPTGKSETQKETA